MHRLVFDNELIACIEETYDALDGFDPADRRRILAAARLLPEAAHGGAPRHGCVLGGQPNRVLQIQAEDCDEAVWELLARLVHAKVVVPLPGPDSVSAN